MYFLGNEIWPELWCQFSKVSRANSILSMDDPCGGSSVQPSAAHLSFDNEPLLGITPASSSNAITTSSFSTTSTSYTSRASPMMMPSTSKACGATTAGTTTIVGAASSVAGPSSTSYLNSTSFSAKNSQPLSSTKTGKAISVNGGVQIHPISSAPLLGAGKKSSKGGGGGVLMKSKPNWSQPGGNEIYELKLDSISTICK